MNGESDVRNCMWVDRRVLMMHSFALVSIRMYLVDRKFSGMDPNIKKNSALTSQRGTCGAVVFMSMSWPWSIVCTYVAKHLSLYGLHSCSSTIGSRILRMLGIEIQSIGGPNRNLVFSFLTEWRNLMRILLLAPTDSLTVFEAFLYETVFVRFIHGTLYRIVCSPLQKNLSSLIN